MSAGVLAETVDAVIEDEMEGGGVDGAEDEVASEVRKKDALLLAL